MAARALHITPANHHRSPGPSYSTGAIQQKSIFAKCWYSLTQYLTFNKRSGIKEARLTITCFFGLFSLFKKQTNFILYLYKCIATTLPLTFSAKNSCAWGTSMRHCRRKPSVRNRVYIARVPVDSLMGGRQLQHRPHDAGPQQHASCNQYKDSEIYQLQSVQRTAISTKIQIYISCNHYKDSHRESEIQGCKGIYLSVAFKCTQEFVFVMSHPYSNSALTNGENITIS